MSEQHYSNDKVDLKLGSLENILLTQNKTLERIETQVIKTNGRVTTLELVNANKKGQTKILAGVISTFLLILAVIAGYFFNQIQQLNINQVKLCKEICEVKPN